MPITEKRRIGNLGEKIAGVFLKNHGFLVVERNYLKKWGEIDIIAKKKGKIHFIEVKTVSRETEFSGHFSRKISDSFLCTVGLGYLTYSLKDTSEGIEQKEDFRPEDNLHPWKLQRLTRTIQSYLAEKGLGEEDDWQFDAICVRLDEGKKYAEIDILEDIIL